MAANSLLQIKFRCLAAPSQRSLIAAGFLDYEKEQAKARRAAILGRVRQINLTLKRRVKPATKQASAWVSAGATSITPQPGISGRQLCDLFLQLLKRRPGVEQCLNLRTLGRAH